MVGRLTAISAARLPRLHSPLTKCSSTWKWTGLQLCVARRKSEDKVLISLGTVWMIREATLAWGLLKALYLQ